MKAIQRRTIARADIPDHPGLYYWSEWKSLVQVVMRGRSLYVTPPNGVEVKITPNIAGRFEKRH